MAVKNMWGNLDDFENVKAPHEILIEQGKALSEMTNGLLELKNRASSK